MAVLPRSHDIPHACAQEGGNAPETQCVQCLISAHAGQIAELREATKDCISSSAEEHDDLWFLRYLLSLKDVKNAAKAVKRGVEWRSKNAKLIDMVRNGECPAHLEDISRGAVMGLHKTKKDGGPVLIIRAGLTNPKLITAGGISPEELEDWFMFEKEKAWQTCDKATRESGKLTKMVTIKDCNHYSASTALLAMRDKRLMKAAMDTAALASDLYPQMVEADVVANIPSVLNHMVTLMKKLLPKRTFEKLRMCPGDANGHIMHCEYMQEVMRTEDLPTFLGGTCDCPGGCIPGVPNSATRPLAEAA